MTENLLKYWEEMVLKLSFPLTQGRMNSNTNIGYKGDIKLNAKKVFHMLIEHDATFISKSNHKRIN